MHLHTVVPHSYLASNLCSKLVQAHVRNCVPINQRSHVVKMINFTDLSIVSVNDDAQSQCCYLAQD